MVSELRASRDDLRATVAAVPRWYHCLDLAPGVSTPGWFDLRPIVSRLPWPDVRGKRCLDVGTSDGFLAFELERRGAGEVVAVDVGRHSDWDWEVHIGALGREYLDHVAGPTPAQGFRVARELLGSSVRLEQMTVYELSPERLGRFEVVVCGSLLLHLRDPLRALAAIRSVCAGQLLCTNQIDLVRSLAHPHQPLARLDGTSGVTQWWIPNAEAHRQMLRAAGFVPERDSGIYCIPFGPAHDPRSRGLGAGAGMLLRRVLAGNDGVPHLAILARAR